jgi:hypothetical protein
MLAFSCEYLGRQCLRDLRRLVEFVEYVPGQEVFDAVDRMIGNPLQNVMQITLRIDFIQFATSCRAPDYAEPLHFSPVFPRFAEHPFGIV